MSKTLVLFDFDGTLTKRDTFPRFIFFSQGYLKGLLGFLIFSPFVILFLFKLINGSTLKEKLISYFFKGEKEDVLNAKGNAFILTLIQEGEINTELEQKLVSHKSLGNSVAVVSASLDIWLRPFCDKHGIDRVCTELEYVNGICTGNLKTPNCNREEKAIRLKQKYDLNDFSKIIAYGNSNGDKAMFALAHETHLIKKS